MNQTKHQALTAIWIPKDQLDTHNTFSVKHTAATSKHAVPFKPTHFHDFSRFTFPDGSLLSLANILCILIFYPWALLQYSNSTQTASKVSGEDTITQILKTFNCGSCRLIVKLAQGLPCKKSSKPRPLCTNCNFKKSSWIFCLGTHCRSRNPL